jgi:hypothetical protein
VAVVVVVGGVELTRISFCWWVNWKRTHFRTWVLSERGTLRGGGGREISSSVNSV